MEVKQIISIYKSHKDGGFGDELPKLNSMLNELEINCKIIEEVCDDGLTLNIIKTEL